MRYMVSRAAIAFGLMAAIALAPVGGHASTTYTRDYVTGAVGVADCHTNNRPGIAIACIDSSLWTSGQHIDASIADASDRGNVAASWNFINSMGQSISSLPFCGSVYGLAIPSGATALTIAVSPIEVYNNFARHIPTVCSPATKGAVTFTIS